MCHEFRWYGGTQACFGGLAVFLQAAVLRGLATLVKGTIKISPSFLADFARGDRGGRGGRVSYKGCGGCGRCVGSGGRKGHVGRLRSSKLWRSSKA